MDRGFGTPGGDTNQWFLVRNFEKKNMRSFSSFFFGENWTLRTSCKNDFPMVRGEQNNLRSLFFFSWFSRPSKNHENTLFRASLEPQGPRDPPCVKERNIFFRIALTRALYDQMAPQLCPLFVPAKKLRSFSSFFRGFVGSLWGHSGIIFRWLGTSILIRFAEIQKVILGKISSAGLKTVILGKINQDCWAPER